MSTFKHFKIDHKKMERFKAKIYKIVETEGVLDRLESECSGGLNWTWDPNHHAKDKIKLTNKNMTIVRIGSSSFIATFGTKKFTKGLNKWSYIINKCTNTDYSGINWGICNDSGKAALKGNGYSYSNAGVWSMSGTNSGNKIDKKALNLKQKVYGVLLSTLKRIYTPWNMKMKLEELAN